VYDKMNNSFKTISVGLLLLGGCGGAGPKPETAGAAPTVKKNIGDPAEMSAPNEGMVKVLVEDVLQQEDGAIVVVLREAKGEDRIVPIFIGETEARAIAMRLTRQKYVRPLTHDLLESIIRECDIKLLKVEIDDLKEKIFLAHLFLVDQSGTQRTIDARPSDAIALALGVNAPIYIALSIIEELGKLQSGTPDESPPPAPTPAAPADSETPLQEI
jgi:bifunctional DNase/RNase